MDFEQITDYAAQRAYMVAMLALDLESIEDDIARRIVLEMMQKLTDTIETHKHKAVAPVLKYNGKPIDE